jgi:phage shock protein A
MAIANYLNAEEHLTEAATKEPHRVKEIAKQLDQVRESRQKLVKEWSKGRANPNHWCNCKHQINACYHLHELITNAARDSPEKVPELTESYKRCLEERDKAVDLFLGGESEASGEGCQRCVADLNVGGTEANPQVYHTVKDSAIWLTLFILMSVVGLMALRQSRTQSETT